MAKSPIAEGRRGPSVLGEIANLEPQSRVQIAGSFPEMSAQVGASAGHVIVNNVMDQLMVGNRRFRGATILGASFSMSSANHHTCVLPTGSEGRDGLGCPVVSPCLYSHAGVRLRHQRLQTLRRPCYRLLRHRSVKVVGTCCTRPWCQGACVRSEQLATVPSRTLCLSSLPTTHCVWDQEAEGR